MAVVAMEENWGVIERHLELIKTLIARIVASGIESGEFRPQDPKQAARCVHFALVGLKHPVVAAQCGLIQIRQRRPRWRHSSYQP